MSAASADKYVIGLTGNIAVGKSVVRQMLQHLGAYTIDADLLSHQAMAPGAPAYKPVVETFGRFVVADDGTINRPILGSIVFSVPEALSRLESIVHPFVNQAVKIYIARAKQRIVVVEAIKLLESDLAKTCNAIWVVDASAEAQLRRLTSKRAMSEDEARKRILAQRPQADKIARANVIIMNEGSVEDTWRQVQAAWNEIARKEPTLMPPRPASATSTGTMQAIPNAAGMAGVARTTPVIEMSIRRGMPTNSDLIAHFITAQTGKQTDRIQVMYAFGQKSYLLAQDKQNAVIGLAGFQVENLITRVDEFYIASSVPREPVVRALANAVEEASRELQSEVSFVYLPSTTQQEMVQAFLGAGYQALKLEEIKFPAWREAAREITSRDGHAMLKQLRADRVMKPI